MARIFNYTATSDNRHSPKLAVGGSAALPEVLTFPDNPTSGAASDVHDPAASEERGEKPRLLVDNCNPDQTVAALRDLLADARGLYDRGVPVRLAFDQNQRGTVAQLMTPDALVLMAHSICRPYVLKAGQDGTVAEVNARLPRSLAVMYLDWRGEWRLPPLNGIASAPLLQDDGTVRSAAGYDPTSGMWCENVPKLTGSFLSARRKMLLLQHSAYPRDLQDILLRRCRDHRAHRGRRGHNRHIQNARKRRGLVPGCVAHGGVPAEPPPRPGVLLRRARVGAGAGKACSLVAFALLPSGGSRTP